MYRPALILACLIGAITVIVGAMGAHALSGKLTESLMQSYETAVKYQFYHVFALALTGIIYKEYKNGLVKASAWLFLSGILLFSGSIYLLVYLKSTSEIGLGGLGAITPIGGVMFILGWLVLMLGIIKKQ